MNPSIFKRFLPHIIAYFVMVVASFLFFSPYLTQGKVLTQSDNVRARAMQGEISKYRTETGESPLWTNSMFGGMPAYQIQMPPGNNLTKYVYKVLFHFNSVTRPHFVVIAAMLSCYLLLIVLGVDWRIAIIGSIGFGLSNYQTDLAEAGHSTKMAAVALVPGLFAGAILAYRGKLLLGGSLFGLFLAMEILANHLQITFYAAWMLLIMAIVYFISAIKNKTLPSFAKASAVLVLAGLLAIGANLHRIWTTQEYSQETIRGKSELSAKEGQEGLSKDYIFGWSYGKLESLTFLIPNFNGGGASQHFRGTELHDKIYRNIYAQVVNQYPRDMAVKIAERQVASYMYWGNQPFVGVAIYFGAVILFLFVLGAFLVKGEIKTWLISAAIFTLLLGWGGNFFLNPWLVDNVPMFNKFRAVSMILGLTHLAVLLLAILGLQALFSDKYTLEAKKRALYIGAGTTLGVCVLAILGSFVMDFSNPQKDARISAQILDIVKADRAAIMRMDALRSFAFIAFAAAAVWAYLAGKLKVIFALAIIGTLSILDVWLVNKRILFAEKYETPREVNASAKPTQADLQILKDKDPHYRVLDLSRGAPFVSADASNFHKSIGGYHAAKLMRLQEVAERYLALQNQNNPLEHRNILGMLNTKYVIQGQGPQAQVGRLQEALGNAWFVENIQYVDNADQELAALDQLNPATTALIRSNEKAELEDLSNTASPSDYIKLTAYHPEKLDYEYQAANDRLAVFSEIYYAPEKGWNLYLDGEPYGPILKANYLLRAARLPAGKHRLSMRFEPQSFLTGNKIALICSLLVLLGFIASLFYYFKNNELQSVDRLDEDFKVKTKPATKATRPIATDNKPKRRKRKK